MHIKGCSENLMYFFFFLFFLFQIHHMLYIGLVTVLTYIVFIFALYIDVCFSPILTCVVSFLSLYTCFLSCMQSIISVSH